MKRFLFFAMAIMFFVMQGWTQTTLNESFEGSTFPPNDWTAISTSGQNAWASSTVMTHTGTKSAYSRNESYGCTRWLITPKLSVTSNNANFSFWLATNYYYAGVDTIQVFVSTTDNLTTSFTSAALLTLTQRNLTTAWTQYNVDLSAYTEQNIYVAIKVVDNVGSSIFIDDVTGPNLFVSSCHKPTNVTVSNIIGNNAQVGWTDATGSLWNVQYMLASSNNWSNAQTMTGITSNSCTITGLNPTSRYKVRVQSDCSTEQSEWTTEVPFLTPCDVITSESLPWSEGFESTWDSVNLPGNATAPKCWININGANSTYKWARSPLAGYTHTGLGTAIMYVVPNNSNLNSDWLITPIFSLTGNEMINFWTKAYSATYRNDISLYIYDVTTNGDLSSAADTSNFVRIYGPEIQSNSWLFHEVYLNSYVGNYRIAFVRNSLPGGFYFCLDDVSVSEIPTCLYTYNLTSSLRSSTEVDLNWMQNIDVNDANGWQMVYGEASTFDTLNTANAITITATTPMPYTITGLNPQTTYKFAVRHNCGGLFSNIVTVTTPAPETQLPYSTDFENSTDNSGWTFINGTQTNQWFIGSATDTLGTNSLYISNDLGVTNAYTAGGTAGVSKVYAYRDFAVPEGVGELKLKFNWKAKGNSYLNDFLRMYWVPLDANITAGDNPRNGLETSAQIGNYTGGEGQQYLADSIYWQTKEMSINTIQFPNLAGRTWRLLIHWRNANYPTPIQPPAAVDNLSLEVICSRPSALADSVPTSNSVYLYWNEAGSATNWIVEYKSSSDNEWSQVQTSSNPYLLLGLTSGSYYQARMRSLCSSTDTSDYSNTISFETTCVNLTVPTNIETFSESVPPTPCWEKKEGILPATGNAILSFVTSSSTGWRWNSNITHNANVSVSGTSCKYWLISPSISLGDGTNLAQLEFDVFYTASYSTDAAGTNGTDDRFAVVVSTDDGLTWNATNATIWSNATGATRVLNNITNIPTRIILPLFDPSTSLSYTGNIKIGFYAESTTSNASNAMHIDNFEVRPYSTCQRPTSVYANNITNTSASITFTGNGSPTTWEYVYGNASLITDPVNGTAISTNDNPFQLTGLTPQTQYNVWVRSVCSDGNSEWSTLCSFVTKSQPATLPYICNFEDPIENLAWRSLSNSDNKWFVGNSVGNGNSTGGTKANYISNDNGLSWAITTGSFYSYTYRDIDFGTDTSSFNLSFDWKCQGNISSNYLYAGLLVYLIDTSDVFTDSYGFPTNPIKSLGSFINYPTWQSAQLTIDTIAGVKRLAFVYINRLNNQDYTPPSAIDNVSVISANQTLCFTPTGLAISDIAANSANISWTAGGSEINWQITTDITSTPIDVNNTPFYQLNGLTSNTNYTVYVRANCGNGSYSPWVSQTFTTTTPPYQLPTVTTAQQIGTTQTSTTLNGSYIEGTNPILVKGFQWKQSSASSWTTVSVSTGTTPFIYALNGLVASTQYDFRAYVETSLDTTYGTTLQFTTLANTPPTVTTTPITNITQTTATFNGTIAQGTEPIQARGFEYKLTTTSTWVGAIDVSASGIATISANATGLTASTQYDVRAYVQTASGRTYGNVENFITQGLSTPPTVTTNTVIGLTQTTATLNGTVIAGTETISNQGFEWKLASASAWNTQPATGINPSYQLTGLTDNTAYQYRAFATTATNTYYGTTQNFSTLAIVPPTVTTNTVSGLTQIGATLYGTVTPGTAPILSQGFEWKETSATTWTVQSATGTTITYTLQSLTPNTSYTYRAFAMTSTDTVRGIDISFTTLSIVTPTVATSAATSVAQTSATLNGTITAGSEPITAKGFDWRVVGTTTWNNQPVTTGALTYNLSALTANTSYEYRAYATTTTTIYGSIVPFTTLPNTVTPPTVVTLPADPINDRSATLRGTITAGSEAITNQGFEWKAVNGTTWTPVTVVPVNDTIIYQLTGIEPETNYEFKAFATTATITEYGTTQTFLTLGISEIDGSVISVIMYPNPASQETKLVVTGLQGEVKITISDVQGRIISTINTKANNNKVEETINVSDMANGVYYVRLQNEQINRTQKLIVK